jgi:carboxyl-terminal processing protease
MENTQPVPPSPSRPPAIQPLWAGLILVVGILIGTYLADTNLFRINTGSEENPNKLVSLIDFIEENYVDSVDKRQLIDGAISSILGHLDPHSYYIAPEEMAQVSEHMKGGYEGIGMEFMILNDTLRVVKTMKGGPAESSGLQTGDKILAVDKKKLSQGLSNDQVQKLLKGKAGSEVKLEVLRLGVSKPMEVMIKRGTIPTPSVPASYVVEPGIGYVQIESFTKTTFTEFENSVRNLKSVGVNTLIVDLRGNSGGLLDQAFLMAESFLTKDKLVLFTEGVHMGKKNYKTTRDGEFRDMKVVVLVDQNSASACEIFAGALQDWDRSTTVGRRTFGKGLVQHEIELPDHSAFRLTIARYYTPTGRCIQKPYSDSLQDYHNEFAKRYASGEFFDSKKITLPDSLKFKTPGGKVVYGGGGITPEVFVPLDTSYLVGLNKIILSGAAKEYCFRYIEKNSKIKSKYSNEDDFVKEFKVTDSMIQEVTTMAKKEKMGLTPAELRVSRAQIQTYLKAILTRYLYSDNASKKVHNQSDLEFLEAVKTAKQLSTPSKKKEKEEKK